MTVPRSGPEIKPFKFTTLNQMLHTAATSMQGAVPQFTGTAVGAGVFLGLSHLNFYFNPCTCLLCDIFYSLKFELTNNVP
jgi:hypothetical protein